MASDLRLNLAARTVNVPERRTCLKRMRSWKKLWEHACQIKHGLLGRLTKSNRGLKALLSHLGDGHPPNRG